MFPVKDKRIPITRKERIHDMNNQTAKKRLRLNFFDILLIILAAIIVIFGGIFLFSRFSKTTNDVQIQYTITIKDVSTDIHIMATPGESVVDTIRLGTIGEVVSFTTEPCKYTGFNQETQMTVTTELEDFVNVLLTVEASAQKNEDAYSVGGVRVAIGSQIYFRTPYYTAFGFVTEVKELNGGKS